VVPLVADTHVAKPSAHLLQDPVDVLKYPKLQSVTVNLRSHFYVADPHATQVAEVER